MRIDQVQGISPPGETSEREFVESKDERSKEEV
jgi:hypothetical protein